MHRNPLPLVVAAVWSLTATPCTGLAETVLHATAANATTGEVSPAEPTQGEPAQGEPAQGEPAPAETAPVAEPAAATPPGSPSHPFPAVGLPVQLPVAVDVKDPVFALLIALVDENIFGTLDQARLQSELDRSGARSKLPYRHVVDVTRLPPGEDRTTVEIALRFDRPLKLPVPYSILGYNPGSFRTTEHCRFREWVLGDVEIVHQTQKDDTYVDTPVYLTDVHLYAITEGEILLDIDGWVDRLMGGSLDDTRIVALMLCRYEGVWHGWAMGYNEDKQGRSGALDFRKDEIVFPTPAEFKSVGRKMRSRAEALLSQVRRNVVDESDATSP